jgi:hypothetical protein
MAPTRLTLLWYWMTGNVQELRLKPGDRVESDPAHVFIVKHGTGQVVRDGPGGHDILLRVVRQGAIVSGGDALMAETPLNVLALPRRSQSSNSD